MSNSSGISNLFHRMRAVGIPELEQIEQFGADGEEAVYRLLRENFDVVIRNVALPHKNLYLEKDFLVFHRGVPFVLEVKNWKGRIGLDGENFCQDKENGVHKVLKSPVGTTLQFISEMKKFYGITRDVVGLVVFAEPDCVSDLPEEMDGIHLLPASKLVSSIKALAKGADTSGEELLPERVLHCTRFYSLNREFCKGILTDREIPVLTEEGAPASLNTLFLRFLSVEHQKLHFRDLLTATFTNGSSGVFYNRDAELTVECLDGTCRRIPLSKIRTIVF